MDTETINRTGIEPVRPLIDAVAGLRDVRDLAAFLGEFERIGGHGLFGSYVDTDSKDSDRYLFNLVQGGLGLPDESYYRDDKFAEIREKYVAYLTRLFTLGGHDDARRRGRDRARDRHPARRRPLGARRDPRRPEDLQPDDQGRPRRALPELRLGRLRHQPRRQRRDRSPRSCVRQPSYFSHLAVGARRGPDRGLAGVAALPRAAGGAAYLTDDFVETNFDFYGRTLNGTPELRARWKRGVAFVEGAIGEAVGKEYVARHFPPRSKAMMDDLVANLLAAYRQSISRLDWMTEETKQRAYEKLDRFRPKIGYPEKFRDYSALQVSRDDLLGNVAAASAFETDRELAKIGSPVDRDEWFMLPQTVNAYYNPGTNEICFPAGILQKPFFSPDAEAAENYGGIGAVIGHEIGHGFDDQGAQYDGDGNLNDWWTPDDKAAFEVKSKTLIEQYDAFEPRALPGEHVNGALTVGENIGDLGGLTIGHTAYLIAQRRRPRPSRTGSKLFLNWAYCWRTKRRKEQEQQYLTIDPHSPPEFRANIVRNLDEFHEVFETAAGRRPLARPRRTGSGSGDRRPSAASPSADGLGADRGVAVPSDASPWSSTCCPSRRR